MWSILKVFVIEVGAAAVIAAGYIVYPDVTWLGNIAWVIAGMFVVLGTVTPWALATAISDVQKVLATPGKGLDDAKKVDRKILEIAYKGKSPARRFFLGVSGICMIVSLAASGWLVSAILYTIFAELLGAHYRCEASDLFEEQINKKADEANVERDSTVKS